MPRFKTLWDEITVSMLASCLMALAVGALIIWWCATSRIALLPLEALAGALVGYAVAIFATPYSRTEKKQFSEFAKIVSGILTGFVLGKASPLIDALVEPPAGGGRPAIAEAAVAEQFLITLISFLLAFLFVFGGRLYWSGGNRQP